MLIRFQRKNHEKTEQCSKIISTNFCGGKIDIFCFVTDKFTVSDSAELQVRFGSLGKAVKVIY